MGAKESTEVRVNFNRPNLFYFAGEKITGNVSFHNVRGKLLLGDIFLEFIGELGNMTQDAYHFIDNMDNPKPERRTEHHRIPFLNVQLPVVQLENGQREIILNHGTYSRPFQFNLPKHLPPSLAPSKTPYPYVKYYIRISLDNLWYKPNVKHIYPLVIFPRVNILRIPSSQRIVRFSYLNRKNVQLDGHLLRGGIIPSENIMMYINLKNPKRCHIKRIEAALIRHHQVAQSHHEETIFRIDLPEIHEFNETKFERTFNLIIPSLDIAPSYKFMAHFNHQNHPVTVKYELALKVKSHGMLTGFDVKAPLIIGTELGSDRQEIDALIINDDEPPPAYETIVSNEVI